MKTITKERFNEICLYAVDRLRYFAPIDTGNLKYNAIRYEWINETTFKIYVDESIAPYMPYTNEKWIAARWNGKKNPNEGWFDSACEFIIDLLTQELHGELTEI